MERGEWMRADGADEFGVNGNGIDPERARGLGAAADGAGASPLAARDPEFYGYCAALNSRLDDATGCLWMAVCLLFVLGASYAVDTYLPDHSDWRIYALIAVVTGLVWNTTDDLLTMRVYRAEREALRDRMTMSGISRYELIGMLGDDDEVDTLVKHLKSDRDLAVS